MADALRIDWLKVENGIRAELRRFRDERADPRAVLAEIDDILGDETGRGYELDVCQDTARCSSAHPCRACEASMARARAAVSG